MIITRQKVQETVHFVPDRHIVYLNNAKVACSSVKKALWQGVRPNTFGGNPHDRQLAPFSRTLEDIAHDLDSFGASQFFTVVRNPYSRILSAYLDKVSSVTADGEEKKRDASVWHPFCRRYRLSSDATLSFGEFLNRITAEDPSTLDQHFAPQFFNTLQPFVSCDFTGHMEQMDRVWSFLSDFGVVEAAHRPHNTKASSSIAGFYGPHEMEMVRAFYAQDFDLFGYSDDPSVPAPVRDISAPHKPRNLICTLVQSYTASHSSARQRCIEALGNNVPDLQTDFNALESGGILIAKLMELSRAASQGNITNWKLAARIAQELLKHDMVFEAAAVTQRAKVLMYGPTPPASSQHAPRQPAPIPSAATTE